MTGRQRSCPRCGEAFESGPVDDGVCPHCQVTFRTVSPADAATSATWAPGSRGSGRGPSESGESSQLPEDLARRFEAHEVLGRGGMGRVLGATEIDTGRIVAIKVLEGASRGEATTRFIREAKLMARIQHPAIQPVFEVGGETSTPYLVTEYAPGGSLRDWLRDHPPGHPGRIPGGLDHVVEIARGLQVLHEYGVIHRDIKPENLLLDGHGQIRIADLGIAKDHEIEDVHLTRTGAIMGTPGYMSPEQVRGEEARESTDFFALGVIVYEILSGRLPYPAATLSQLASLHRRGDPPPPVGRGEVAREPPSGLVRFALRAVSVDPTARLDSAETFLRELEAARKPRRRWLRAFGVGLLLALILAVGLRTGLQTSPERRMGELLARGQLARQEFDCDGAIESFRLALSPALAGTGQPSEAEVEGGIGLSRALADRADHGAAGDVLEELEARFAPHVVDPGALRVRVERTFNDLEIGRYGEAVRRGRGVVRELSRLPEVDPSLAIEARIVLSFALQKEAAYAESRALFEKACRLARQSPDRGGWALVRSLHRALPLFRMDRILDPGSGLLRQILRRLEIRRGKDHPDLCLPLLLLARSEADQGRLEEAEALYRHALTVAREGRKRHRIETLGAFGAHLMQRARFEEADEILRRELAIWEEVAGEEHPRVARCLENLGTTRSRRGRFLEAEPLLERAARIYERCLGAEHPRLGSVLGELGVTYMHQNRPDEALEVLGRAYAIDEKAHSGRHASLVMHQSNIARVHERQGRLEAAEGAHRKAVEIAQRAFGHGSHNAGIRLHDLARVLVLRGKLEEAERIYAGVFPRISRLPVRLRDSLFWSQVVDIHLSIMQLYVRKGGWPQAKTAMNSALEILESHDLSHPFRNRRRGGLGRLDRVAARPLPFSTEVRTPAPLPGPPEGRGASPR